MDTKATTRTKRAFTKRRIAPPRPTTLNPIVCSSWTSFMRSPAPPLPEQSRSPGPCDSRPGGFLQTGLPRSASLLLSAEGGDPEDERDHQTEQKGIQRHEGRSVAQSRDRKSTRLNSSHGSR